METELAKLNSALDTTLVCIDSTRMSVRVEPTKAWFPRNSKPAVELSDQRKWTGVLGAINEDGRTFFCPCDE